MRNLPRLFPGALREKPEYDEKFGAAGKLPPREGVPMMEPEPGDMEHTDADLVRRCARGEEGAFRTLVERVERPLINFIIRYLGDRDAAEDVFQDTLVRVLRNIADFEPQASLTTWIFTIARNRCLDILKAKKRHREVSMDAPRREDGGRVIDFRDILRERGRGPEEGAAKREWEERVQRALGTLSPAKREALVLRVFVGLGYREMSGIVGSPVGTLKFRVHEAIRNLAGLLEEPREIEDHGQAING